MSDGAQRDAEYSLASHVLYVCAWPVVRAVMVILFRLKITGREHQPRRGRVIYASNHISAWDPPVVGASVRRNLMFLAKKELFSIPVFGAVIRAVHARPVDRGGYSRAVLELMRARLERDGAVLMFPEGTRRRDGKLGEGKIGVGMLAVLTGAPVVPVYVCGTTHPLRALLFRSRFRVALGPVVRPPNASTPSDRKQAYQAVTDEVMATISRLKAEIDE